MILPHVGDNKVYPYLTLNSYLQVSSSPGRYLGSRLNWNNNKKVDLVVDPDLEVREGWMGWERTRVRVGKEVSLTKQTEYFDLLGPLSQIAKEKEWTPPPPTHPLWDGKHGNRMAIQIASKTHYLVVFLRKLWDIFCPCVIKCAAWYHLGSSFKVVTQQTRRLVAWHPNTGVKETNQKLGLKRTNRQILRWLFFFLEIFHQILRKIYAWYHYKTWYEMNQSDGPFLTSGWRRKL